MQLTHFAPATNMLWKHIESCGHDPAPVYRKAGINPALLKKSDARITISHVDELWYWLSNYSTTPVLVSR